MHELVKLYPKLRRDASTLFPMRTRGRAREGVAAREIFGLVSSPGLWQTQAVNYLTKQQQMVLGWILLLLLTGWAVKTYRAAHPPARPAQVETR